MFAVTPDWSGYTGYSRLIQAAWDALLEHDPYELQINHLARAACVSKALFHKRFPNLNALLNEVVAAGFATLLVNLQDEDTFEDFAISWIRFADARPRHYSLMFSPRFAEHPKVTLRMTALSNCIRSRAEARLGFMPTTPQIQAIFGIIHGTSSLVATGFVQKPQFEPIAAYLALLQSNPDHSEQPPEIDLV